VNITFSNNKLEKIANNDRERLAKLGKIRANKLKQRLDDLFAAKTLEDVRYLPGRYHELIENRKGQWACDLDQPYRLIFTPHPPIPIDIHGRFIWPEITGVEIIQIADYH